MKPPEMVDPDGGRSTPPSVNSGTHPSSMLKMLSLMDASTTCTEQSVHGSGRTYAANCDGGNLEEGHEPSAVRLAI